MKHHQPPRFGTLRRMAVVLVLLAVRGANAEPVPTYSNVPFATVSGGLTLRLDLYIPNISCGQIPVVIYLHGGGWLSGDKLDAGPHVSKFLQRGLAVASIDYRLSYQAHYPAQIHDCKGAVRWLRAHANDYNFDPNRIGVFGESAGGHLAALLGTTGGVSSLEGTVGGNTGQSSRVQAVADMAGASDLFALGAYHDSDTSEESLLIGHSIPDIIAHMEDPSYQGWVALVNSANPILAVSSDDAPFYIAHGGADTLVPPSQATMLANALHSAGVEYILRIVPNGVHDLPPTENTPAYNFLESHLAAGTTSTLPPQIESIANATINAGTSYQVQPSLTQPACMGAVIWSLTSGPSGMIINRSSGAVAWSAPTAGSYTIAIRAVNESGSDTESWTLTVQPQTPPPPPPPPGGFTRRFTLNGHAPGEQFGRSIANAGDVNNDGYDDFIIGAPGNSENGPNAGKVYVYSGRTGGLFFSVRGRKAGDRFGWSVACAGDVNNDGRSDFLVGAPYNDDNGLDAGKVYLYAGGSWALLRTRSGHSGDRFGWSLAGGLHYADDAHDNMLVGAPYNDDAGTNVGAVYLYSGSAMQLRATVHGNQAGELFGSSVARVGHADQDDDDDFIVGAPRNDDAGDSAGKIYVYFGRSTDLVYTKTGQRAGDQFGRAVTGGGDFNGDGRDDFAVGAVTYDAGAQLDAGRAYVYAAQGPLSLWKITGALAGDHLGCSVSICGDVNGDGFDDLLVGSPTSNEYGSHAGYACVCSGRNGAVLGRIYGEAAGDQCGYAVAPAGDVNHDGKADIIVAAPFHDGAGRVSVYLAP